MITLFHRGFCHRKKKKNPREHNGIHSARLVSVSLFASWHRVPLPLPLSRKVVFNDVAQIRIAEGFRAKPRGGAGLIFKFTNGGAGSLSRGEPEGDRARERPRRGSSETRPVKVDRLNDDAHLCVTSYSARRYHVFESTKSGSL